MGRWLAKNWHRCVHVLSGEWMLTFKSRRPNGGSVILARSLWCAGIVYGLILIFRDLIDPSLSWRPSVLAARQQLLETLPWFGAIFAACYASLYSRFSAQWTYLAALYNQIVATQIGVAGSGKAGVTEMLVHWKAGFIEDADDLHLATKPVFANAIRLWLEDEAITTWFADHTVGGKERLDAIREAADRYTKLWASEVAPREHLVPPPTSPSADA
ncbi:MAG TPA: hypothetical protein VGM77_02990 [Gemmatimonadales bacterium]